ncbi:DNA replication ATPase [Akanthomyces lecanii RCEF 1005]|uniref:DNA replication ATPase n=1 Tax=Akanthomyces lecanii RCEF 1005 TaxID=1081108 RepID=A0A162K5V7_CORDF|nr:DNA replication ATPase [Akanthomyces lecanii RCEF 1005]
MSVDCPICNKPVKSSEINSHIDSGCASFIVDKESPPSTDTNGTTASSQQQLPPTQKRSASSFFSTPAPKRQQQNGDAKLVTPVPLIGKKRGFDEGPGASDANISPPLPRVGDLSEVPPLNGASVDEAAAAAAAQAPPPPAAAATTPENGKLVKRTKLSKAAPLAERMRPTTLDDVCGQELVGRNGVLRSLIESDRVPSMILWGGAGTGKTTIARCIAHATGRRFVEINATSSSVGECKKLFQEAASDLALAGRRTIIFCDEIHRFNKAQQDVFLRPVEAGTVTLIGATTENPSFKVVHALLSRCRTFTLQALGTDDVAGILRRARDAETAAGAYPPTELVDDDMLRYLARFSDGDARTALNLLELALSLTARPGMTQDGIKAALTKTLVYDRGGDQHYDTISAFHKSVRGGDADAALYYLARMLQSGEDPLFVARRMVVIASEDVGLADSSLLPLATAAYTAAQQIGMPEARIPLAHCAVALCLAPKSTRAYRGLNNAYTALREPGVAALPVPLHLRNAPTRLMRDLGCGAEYKYPPNYRDGRVSQTYLPEQLLGRRFLEDRDLGTEVDPDVVIKDDSAKP